MMNYCLVSAKIHSGFIQALIQQKLVNKYRCHYVIKKYCQQISGKLILKDSNSNQLYLLVTG